MGHQHGICSVCDQLAGILQGKTECMDQVCTVTVDRTNLDATILGRRTRAEEILGVTVIFEDPDDQGRTLNTLEATLLKEEINPFIDELRAGGILLSALHNHWLFEHPRLMYVHGEAVSDPVQFAETVARAMRTFVVPIKPA